MLHHDFLTNKGKVIHKWHHYLPIYERHLQKFVNQSVTIWEIGVFQGGSLSMWKRFLGPFATVVGIDIDAACKAHEEHQIQVRIGDQSDMAFLQTVLDEFGVPDIIIDDGSHQMKHLTKTFDFLYPKLSKNGVYIVEDLHTAYWSEFEGGLRRKGSFIEKSKDQIDDLNARHIRENHPTRFAETTFSMCFYDSLIVYERVDWSKSRFLTHTMIP